MNKKIIATSIVALMPACVAGDPESLICIDWEADGIDQCADSDGVDAPPPEEPEPPAVACDLIGDALGFDLVEVHPLPVSAGVWMGLSSAELVFSPDIVGFFWHWLPGGDPGDPAVLDSLESDLVIYTTTPDLGQALLGYAYVEPGTGGSATLVREDPQLGPPVEVAAFSVPLGTEAQLFYATIPDDGGDVPHRWTLSGGLRARGVVTPGNSTLAGPSGGNVMITEEGMPSRGFLPTMGWCAPAPAVADDAGEPEPMPDVPEPEPMPSPCEALRPPPSCLDCDPWIFVGEIPLMLGTAVAPDPMPPSAVSDHVVWDDVALAWSVHDGPSWAVGTEFVRVHVPFGPNGVADLRVTWAMVDSESAETWELSWRQETPGEGGPFDMVYGLEPFYSVGDYALVATGELPPAVPDVDAMVGTQRWGFNLNAETPGDALAGTGAVYLPGTDDGGFWPYACGAPFDTDYCYDMKMGDIGWTPYGGTCLYNSPAPPPSADGGSGG